MQATQNAKKPATSKFEASQLIWALGSVCTLHHRNFSPDMLVREFPPQAHNTGERMGEDKGGSYSESTLLHAAQRLGFRVKRISLAAKDCASLPLPLLVQVNPPPRSCCLRRYR